MDEAPEGDAGYFSMMEEHRGGIHVLHVDDEPTVAETAAAFLRRGDDRISVTTVPGPNEALDALSEQSVDCIVSDYDMPELNGLELLERVREEHPDLPFVLFTGKGSEEIASEAISAGVTDYLRKGAGTEQYDLLANRIRNATAQFRASEAAAWTESRLRELAERTDDVLWTFTGDWSKLLFVNDAYEQVYGGSVDELAENPTAFIDVVHPADRDRVRAEMERLSGGEPAELEYRVGPDADYERWVWVSAEPVVEDGEVVRIVGFSRDVTERERRKAAVEELHAATRKLMSASTPTEIATLVVEATRDVLDIPLAGCWLYDESADALEPVAATDTADDIVGEPPRFEAGEGLAWTVFERGEPRRYDDVSTTPGRYNESTPIRAEVLHPLGEFGLLTVGSTTAGAFDDVDESLIGLLATNAEAALMRANRESTLRDERAFIDQALDALADVFYVLDTDGRVRRWNERAVTVTGYDDEALDGLDAVSLFAADHRERVADSIETAFAEGHAAVTADIVTAEGDRIPFEFTAARLADADGTPTGLVGVGRDIGDRRERERALEAQNRRLERFARIVSHDLQNPLSVAQGRLELARERLDGENDDLEAVAGAHERMTQLIDDLLALARQGETAREERPVSVAALATESWEHVDSGAARLAVETDAVVLADEGQLRGLLENLLGNAVEHGRDEADPLTVTVGAMDDGFYVADDGVGIPPDERGSVFDAGYTTGDGSTGLGLSIVEEAAEAHGWTVTVTESEAGGARFEVRGVEFASTGDGSGPDGSAESGADT
jgi:PAS domain S-box-containing protein